MAEVRRFEFIDLFKGIGIIFMIIGHVGVDESFSHYISAFHMPMFFFISGYLFKSYDFKDLLKRKFGSLIKPYLWFGAFNAIACLLLVENFKIGTFIEKLFFFNNRHLAVAGALWFLTCLFFLNIIFWFIHKHVKNKYLLGVILFLIAISEFFLKIRLPYSIDSALYMLPVFYAGFMFKDFEPNLKKWQGVIFAILCFIVSLFCIFKNGHCGVRANEYSNLALFYFNAIIATLAYFYFSKFICNFLPLKSVQYIGRNSINYLCLNQIVIKLISNFAEGTVQCFVLSLLVISVLSVGVNKIKVLYKSICEYFQDVRSLTE